MLMTTITAVIQGMHEIAKQASILATGLQNAAPPGASLQSVQYLVEIAAHLEKTCHEMDELSQSGSKELEEKLLQQVRTTVLQDEELRKTHQIADKFRFVRERLQAIHEQLEKEIQATTKHIEQQAKKSELQEDEMRVYVYLYNANGVVLSAWQNLLTPKVFYEYSVNRPIYTEESHIQMLLRSKTNKTQHAYLTVAVKTAHVIKSETGPKDSLGNSLVKIKEGSLSFEKFLRFTFNEQDYVLSVKGELVKKDK